MSSLSYQQKKFNIDTTLTIIRYTFNLNNFQNIRTDTTNQRCWSQQRQQCDAYSNGLKT